MWGASNHLHAVGHRHAGHLQGGLQVGGAIVYPRDYVAVKIKQRYHFANWSSTSPTAINSHLRRELVRCLACHGSTFSRVGASGKPGAVQIGCWLAKRWCSLPASPKRFLGGELSRPAFGESGGVGFQRVRVEGVRIEVLAQPFSGFGVAFMVRI